MASRWSESIHASPWPMPTLHARGSARQRFRERNLRLETLEERMLLAIGPQLIGVQPNDGDLLADGAVRHVAPLDLTFRFDQGQVIDGATLGGIRVTRAGFDGVFGDARDVVVEPGFVGVDPTNPNEVVVRFAETLPDDLYRIDVIGSGATPLRNVEGDAFNNGTNVRLGFELDLGAQVVAVVPQPIARGAAGALVQARNQIVVYFNDDDLHHAPVASTAANAPAAVKPEFYQLIYTAETVTNTDDVVHHPTLVEYNPVSDTAVLTFARDLELLSGVGTYRLRVGTAEPVPLPPQTAPVASDPGSSFDTARDLGVVGAQSRIISEEIVSEYYPLAFPGATDEPGHRDISAAESHLLDSADSEAGITSLAYNFRVNYGRDAKGNRLFNVITETQKKRAREALEIYAHYLGVQFYETEQDGLTIATGDLGAFSRGVSSAPGGVTGMFGQTRPEPGTRINAVILDNAETWNDAAGGDWFQVAMRHIGRWLGMGDTNDLPGPTITGSDESLAFGNELEPIFPGDHAIVHGQYLFRPDSTDIDLYRFAIQDAGLFTVETIAERQADSSLLDTALVLYRVEEGSTPRLIARNDDYFSEDSLIKMALRPGVYYVGVSASGNTSFDPTIEDTGIGGTTEGAYALRLNFRPEVTRTIVDATGTALDGDADGVPGGVYNFWFRAALPSQTVFVDKAHAPQAGLRGTIANPFDQIDDAFAAADPGDVVRIVGNGGADGLLSTVGDNLAYEIGRGDLGVLADGVTARLPRSVTVMVDAGAIFKLRQTAIQVGSSSVAINRSGAALQILGTPAASVIFTSYNDESTGVDNNPVATTPGPGDWGGLLFRADLDRAEGRADDEQQGIFLNYVNHADIRYGGGNVTLDSVQQVIDPIHLIDARPTITFNTITRSADAGISANPDSFEETNYNAPDSLGIDYQAVPFTADYDRVGPEIHGNRLLDNTTNGLFIRTSTPLGGELERLSVTGRWDDIDIVHTLSENLILAGTPGGPWQDPETGALSARTDAQLFIDPGTIVKLDGARIEATMGTQVVAEGVDGRRVVMTSMRDSRFGAGGTFDTKGRVDEGPAVAGDWGGLYVGRTAALSLDYVLLAYGGGVVRVEGSFAGFNVIELHQAEARITNSILEYNANGRGGQAAADRAGRAPNSEAVIFVRASQPVIVDNVIRNSTGPRAAAISIDVNSLNYRLLTDPGRATGAADRITDYRENQGPLIRGNRLGDNVINGMIVRGATLTTESVWDDTDIVHVVFDEIFITNFHTYGGLRLESSPTESLVVKLSGADAGFHVTGKPLDIDDRIGGMLHVVGQPGRPVVLTSLADDSVGAGFDTRGQAQNDTDGGGRPLPVEPAGSFHIDINFSPAAASDPDVVAAVERAARTWERLLEDPITVTIDFDVADLPDGTAVVSEPDMVRFNYSQVRGALITDARSHEAIVTELPQQTGLKATLPSEPSNPFTLSTQIEMTHANALALKLRPAGTKSVYDPDETRAATITLALDPLTTTNSERPILFDYDRSDLIQSGRFDATGVVLQAIGKALGFVSAVDDVDAGLNDPTLPRTIALSTLDLFRLQPGAGAQDFATASRALDPRLPHHVFYDGGQFDPSGLGLPGYTVGDIPLSTGVEFGDGEVAGSWKDDVLLADETFLGVMDPRFRVGLERPITDADRQAFDLIGYDVVGGGVAGDWRGITIEQYAHDRNVAVVTEQELQDVTGPGTNATPDQAEYAGTLAPNEKSGDDTRRLGFDLQGLLNNPVDVDVYSFRAMPGTEVWFDIDRTTSTLDTVVELIDADGVILARSDNSYAEALGLEDTLYAAPGITVHGLQKSIFRAKDYWSTNAMDAGMRVVLPGTSTAAATYHVRVRSSGPDLDDVAGGLTAGVYQLEIRLQDTDELPGTSVEYADIRYATDGIRVRGGPTHSPLLGEVREDESDNDRLPVATMPEWRFFSSLRAAGEPNQGETLDGQGWQQRNMFRYDFLMPDDASPYEEAFDDPQQLGNVLTTDRAGISVSGTLDPRQIRFDPTDGFLGFLPDVDWYYFQVGPQDLGSNNPYAPYEAVELVFDVDYADGLGRADTALYVFQPHFAFGDPLLSEPFGGVIDATIPNYTNIEDDIYFDFADDGWGTTQDLAELLGATLLYASTSSLDNDDQPAPMSGADLDDLSRGSVGSGDPLLGPISLMPGTYLLAVTSAGNVPSDLDQFEVRVSESDFLGRANPESAGYFPASDYGSQPGELAPRLPNNPYIRVEPIDSIKRIAEDHIAEPIFEAPGPTVYDPPDVPVLLDASSAVPFSLGDLTLFVSSMESKNPARTVLSTVDPFTGTYKTDVGTMFTQDEQGNENYTYWFNDIAFQDDGRLYAFTQGTTDAESGNYLAIDTGDASMTGLGEEGAITDDGIETYEPDPADPELLAVRARNGEGWGVQFQAWAYAPNGVLYAVGYRFVPKGILENILYMFDPVTGRADNGPGVDDRNNDENTLVLGAMTQKWERGILITEADPNSPDKTVIVATDATRGTNRDLWITDGLTFVVGVPGSTSLTTFELNSGPEVTFEVDPLGQAKFVRDGDKFKLDDTWYEFDTGGVLEVPNQPFVLPADGSLFKIVDNRDISVTFEFDADGSLSNNAHVAVRFQSSNNWIDLTTAIVAAINGVDGFSVEAAAVGNRITLTKDSTTFEPWVAPESRLAVLGARGVTGSVAIPVEETFTSSQFATAIGGTIDSTPQASVAGSRITFSGAVTSDFSEIVARGVFIDQGSDGNVGTRNVPVNFLAEDLAADIAQHIRDALAGAGFTATVSGSVVVVDPEAAEFLAADLPFKVAGAAPGGTITGLTFMGNDLYAVTDAGGLFQIRNYSVMTAEADYVETAAALVGTKFTGLTSGPAYVEDGRYADLMFAINEPGAIRAFDTTGALQAVFAGGQTRVQTGIANANGLAFSSLENNLWHITTRRGGDAGHGGGYSFYFGEEQDAQMLNHPGGAHGSLVSNTFSLEGYDAADVPALYFNYFLATEHTDQDEEFGIFSGMTDSFRVFIADDSREDGRGQWHLLATNNPAEIWADNDPFDDIDIDVQVLFDQSWEDVPDPNDRLLRNGQRDPYTEARADAGVPDETQGIWRQARILLDDFAGRSDLRLRFDFSTAGSMDLGNPATTGSELRAIDGSRLRDGDTFTIDGVTFEFELGYTLLGTGGSAIADGETFRIGDGVNAPITFEFDRNGTVAGTNMAISVDDSQSAATVAGNIAAAIGANGPAGVVVHRNGTRIHLEGAVEVVPSLGAAIDVEGAPGTSAGIPIAVHAGMTAVEVAEALIQPIADAFAVGNATVIKSYKDFVRIIGHTVTDPGPLALADQLPGDQYGAFYSNTQGQKNDSVLFDFTEVAGYGEDNNFSVDIEGAYVDDLIIGFAGRGEQVIDYRWIDFLRTDNRRPSFFETAPGNREYYLPESVNFISDPFSSGIVEGQYDLEIRRGSDYTVSGSPARSFDPRDRFAEVMTLDVPAGADLVDGQTFTISDGLRSATFEYNDVGQANGVADGNIPVPFHVVDSAAQVAGQVELAINGRQVQQMLQLAVKAVSSASSSRVDLLADSIDVQGEATAVFSESGSQNMVREQGQLLIANNQISHSAMFGIVVEDSERDLPSYVFEPQNAHSQFTVGDYVPHSGPVRNLEELNDENLAPGVTIVNNVIAYGGEGGIHFSGDPNGFVIIPPLGGGYSEEPITSEVWDPGGPRPLPSPFAFSVTDNNGLTVTFEFDSGDGVAPGHVPIVFTPNEGCPDITGGGCMPRYHWSLRDMTDQMIETIVGTDLDITVYRGRSDEIFLEGAADVRGVTPGPNPPLDWFEPWYSAVQPGMVPFGRLVNNTIVGLGGTFTGWDDTENTGLFINDIGILLEDNARPTLLNNIVVNVATGVAADDSSQPSVLGGNLFQGNKNDLRNLIGDDFTISLADTEPLFVDFASGNFYLAAGSRAIDSSIDSLEERPELAVVKEPLGVALSPIVAPNRDSIGQLRVDDPTVEPPSGLGEKVFKDRGAIDRADFTGPTAQLLNPRDNDASGSDLDPATNVVQLGNVAIGQFSVQFADGAGQTALFDGTGTDRNTVSGDVVTVTRVASKSSDVVLLQEGIDYTFSYDATNGIMRLTPLAGVWATNNTYFITLDNSAASGVKDVAGNPLRRNQADGQTRFTIGLGALEDFGDAPDPTYPTLLASDGARHTILGGFFLGTTVDAELNGQPTVGAQGDVPDEDGVELDALLILGAETSITVTASTAGLLDAWIDFNGDGDWNDVGEQIFTSAALTAGTNERTVAVPPTAAAGATYARFRFSSAGGLLPTGPAADGEVEDYMVVISANPWQNPRNSRDIDDDSVIAPIDALRVINELNNRNYSDRVTGALRDTPPFPLGPGGKAPYFYDVNGDGYATSIDALIVINELNRQAQAAGQAMAGTAASSTALVEDRTIVTGFDGATDAALAVALVTIPTTVSPTADNPTMMVATVAAGAEQPEPVDRRDTAPRASAADSATRAAQRDRITRRAATDLESLVDAIAEDVGIARRTSDPREEAFAGLG